MTTNRLRLVRLPVWLSVLFLAPLLRADTPQWIWHDNHGAKTADGEVRYFRKDFDVSGNVSKAILSCAADDQMQIYLNGEKITEVAGWNKASSIDVTRDIRRGKNVLAIRGTNNSDAAAVIVL